MQNFAENIHTLPTEGIGNSWVVERSVRPKNLKKCMELIVISRGVRDLEKKKTCVGEVYAFSGTTQSS